MGEQNILKTMLLLALGQDASEIKDLEDLKARIQKFYLKVNPQELAGNHRGSKLSFIEDESILKANTKIFNVDTHLNDIQNQVEQYTFDKNELERVYTLYQRMIKKAQEKVPGFKEIFYLAMSSIFYAKSNAAGGGTTSAAIGILWCDHRENWSELDFIEFFVHELTHTCLFLDERRFVHYTSIKEIEREENYAYSAILNRKRPLDKVVHSIMVATEIVLLRENVLGHPVSPKLHPPSQRIIKNTLIAIESAKAKRAFLTARTLNLLNICQNHLENINVTVHA